MATAPNKVKPIKLNKNHNTDPGKLHQDRIEIMKNAQQDSQIAKIETNRPRNHRTCIKMLRKLTKMHQNHIQNQESCTKIIKKTQELYEHHTTI